MDNWKKGAQIETLSLRRRKRFAGQTRNIYEREREKDREMCVRKIEKERGLERYKLTEFRWAKRECLDTGIPD